MNLKSGQFFLDPQWPFQSDENNPRFANFDFDYEEDACLCKAQDQEYPLEVVKVQHESNELMVSQIEKDNYESSIANQSASELMIEESQSSAVVIKQQESENDQNQELVHQFNQLQSAITVAKPRIRKRYTKKDQIKLELKSKGKKNKQYERGKYNILSEGLKKKIVDQSKEMTMVQVAKKYNVSVNNICRWKKRCDRRSGAGRKVTDMEMQCKLLQWLLNQNSPIPRKEVQLKAKSMSGRQNFKASKGWFQRFYKRNKLQCNTRVEILTHNDYRQRIGKLALEKQKESLFQLKQEEDQSD